MFLSICGGTIADKHDGFAVNRDYFKMSWQLVLWNADMLSNQQKSLGSILTISNISKQNSFWFNFASLAISHMEKR